MTVRANTAKNFTTFWDTKHHDTVEFWRDEKDGSVTVSVDNNTGHTASFQFDTENDFRFFVETVKNFVDN